SCLAPLQWDSHRARMLTPSRHAHATAATAMASQWAPAETVTTTTQCGPQPNSTTVQHLSGCTNRRGVTPTGVTRRTTGLAWSWWTVYGCKRGTAGMGGAPGGRWSMAALPPRHASGGTITRTLTLMITAQTGINVVHGPA